MSGEAVGNGRDGGTFGVAKPSPGIARLQSGKSWLLPSPKAAAMLA